VSKSTKVVKKVRSLDEREADLNQKLKKITLLKQIQTNRAELKRLKTTK
jgi:predicted DNA binding CopG/RHH family protein